MLQKIKNYATIILTFCAFSVPLLIPATSLAANCGPIAQNISNGVAETTPGASSPNCGSVGIDTGIRNTAIVVVDILSVVVGVVAVIMIIYGGFRYITSGGESGNVQSAKNTLLFAIVGLVIVALAQIIVRWVIGTSTNIASSPTGFLHF